MIGIIITLWAEIGWQLELLRDELPTFIMDEPR